MFKILFNHFSSIFLINSTKKLFRIFLLLWYYLRYLWRIFNFCLKNTLSLLLFHDIFNFLSDNEKLNFSSKKIVARRISQNWYKKNPLENFFFVDILLSMAVPSLFDFVKNWFLNHIYKIVKFPSFFIMYICLTLAILINYDKKLWIHGKFRVFKVRVVWINKIKRNSGFKISTRPLNLLFFFNTLFNNALIFFLNYTFQ